MISFYLGGKKMNQKVELRYKLFEEIKNIRGDGSEYWKARNLARALEYADWRNFYRAMQRAMIACENSGYKVKG